MAGLCEHDDAMKTHNFLPSLGYIYPAILYFVLSGLMLFIRPFYARFVFGLYSCSGCLCDELYKAAVYHSHILRIQPLLSASSLML
jgi:hypothetical protein